VFYNPEKITIGDNVRIDDFCVISGGDGITIGSHVHIACGCYLFGGAGIILEDFVGLSMRVNLISQSDDYYGNSLTNPTIPMKFKPEMKSGQIIIKRHSILGTGSTVMPAVRIEEGGSFGAYSLINKDTLPWSVYAGIPAKKIDNRSKKMLELEKQFLEEYDGRG
jgi:acetyltransferase-like isoleucine patch superfamily enzyme